MSNLKLKINRQEESLSIDNELDRILGLEKEAPSDVADGPSEKKVRPNHGKLKKVEPITKLSKQSKKKGSRKVNKYFYKVSNHHELFKIGSSFYHDYLEGVKSFAITSTGYQMSQQTSILGLASFFDHKEHIKIGIVSNNLVQGSFKEIIELSEKEKVLIHGDLAVDVHNFYDHFHFINLRDLLKISSDGEREEYDEVFDSFADQFDIVFWDVPDLEEIQRESEKYFPMIMKFESLSIIVSKNVSSSKHLDGIRSFFLGYGINLKGLLLETQEEVNVKDEKGKVKKRSWWRIFG